MRGKSIKIFLMDAEPNGRWICELSNWTGKAYRIPRTHYKLCLNREELRTPSIYFLFGYDDETGEPVVYIGETEDALKRLGEHVQDSRKDYWHEAIVFFNKDDNLNKAHIKFLESKFYDMALDVKRYKVMNNQQPKRSMISEAEESDMEEFIDNCKIVLSALGHKAFDKLTPQKDQRGVNDQGEVEYLYIKNRNGVDAQGFMSSEGFVVCKGSTIRDGFSEKSIGSNIVKLRNLYESDGTIENRLFTKDILFTSPSAASDLILGNSTSGPLTWKNEKGIALKELMKTD
jgi:hypothetical protein